MPFRRLRLLLLAAAAGASLAGCSGTDSPLTAQWHPPNAADATFLRSMTEHEEATLGVTRLSARRALRLELRRIARTMTTEADANLHALGSLAQGISSTGPPPATTARAAVANLARVKDATSFDHEFMRTMIERNQEAIAIARQEVRFGSDPDIKRLAAAIEKARKKELEQLRGWLRLWYGGEVQPGPPPLPPPGGGGDQAPGPVPPV